jgi:hypothetical protein
LIASNAFQLADRLARSLGDYKHQFSFVWHSDIPDEQKLAILHQELIRARLEILTVEAAIFGEACNE